MSVLAIVSLLACSSSSESTNEPPTSDAADTATTDTHVDDSIGTDSANDSSADVPTSSKRGFPEGAPWVSFYGTASEMGDLKKVADTFRVINIDVDPEGANFTKAEIVTLKNGGKNRVISYFNLGSCEDFRSYWDTVPSGFVSCSANKAAQRGAYDGYPDETWMDVGNADYQKLLVEHVAPRLVDMGIDGFFFDNLEIVEHGTATTNGPCDKACSQGGLDLVRKLREKFPDMLFVMQNATSTVTMNGKTGGLDYPTLLDGISHEEPFTPMPGDKSVQDELVAWKKLGLSPGGHAFWIATEDYVGTCTNTKDAKAIYDASRAIGFSPYATDDSAGQKVVCYWGF